MRPHAMKSLEQISEQLNITPAIVRSWQINLNLQLPPHANDVPIFNEDWEIYFEKVAHLRKQGVNFKKIRTQLAAEQPSVQELVFPEEPTPDQAPKASPSEPFIPPAVDSELLPSHVELPAELASSVHLVPLSDNKPMVQNPESTDLVLQRDLNKMTQTYVQLVENYQALASRYSESTFHIGQLEEKNRALEDKAQLLEDTKNEQIEQLESHISALKEMLEAQEQRLDHADQNQAHKTDVAKVESQLKLLAATVFRQQDANTNEPHGFWGKLKASLFKPL